MKITFEKRIYNIQHNDDVYEITYIVKHPIEEYNYEHIASILKFKEFKEQPELSGFYHCTVSTELETKLLELIKQNKDE